LRDCNGNQCAQSTQSEMTTPKYGTNQQVAVEPGQSELMMLKIARKPAPD